MSVRLGITRDDRCYLCGRKATETHHLMNGVGLRKKSDQDGLTVRLCRECHARIHFDPNLQNAMKQEAQRIFEATHTHKEWMARYHKNYLDEEDLEI